MKRSEMLKMIEDFMEQNNEDPILTKQEAAEVFLKFVESKGMLPPETKSLPSDFTNTGFSQEFLDEHEFKVNRWEPEDEKK